MYLQTSDLLHRNDEVINHFKFNPNVNLLFHKFDLLTYNSATQRCTTKLYK